MLLWSMMNLLIVGRIFVISVHVYEARGGSVTMTRVEEVNFIWLYLDETPSEKIYC